MMMDETLLGREEYKQHARQLAKKHGLISNSQIRIETSILECEEKFENIRQVYKELNADMHMSVGKSKKSDSTDKRGIPAATILIENYYVILGKINEIKGARNGSDISALPERLTFIAQEMIAHTDCSIDENKIFEFISAYQEIVPLTSDEIWWLGIMIKMKLIHKISGISNAVYEIKRQRDIADRMSGVKNAERILSKDPQRESSLIEHFSYKKKEDRVEYLKFKEKVDSKYEAINLSLNELINFENERQNALQISLGNAISSLRIFDGIDFQKLFERLSYLEDLLNGDPTGLYSKMDSVSKDYYRKSVVKRAKKEKVSEFFIAKKALEEAHSENEHIGKYIIKSGRNGREIMSYKAAIISGAIVSTFFLILYAYTRSERFGVLFAILAALLSFPVMLEIFTQIVQKSFMSILKPATLPRLDFKDGIPKEYSVAVIIPTLLSSEKRVEELCVQLEMLYSINGGENIYFSIVGDLPDAQQEVMEADENIERKGIELIEKLNEKYGEGIFHFYLRKRTYNERQSRWLGRERKRGAIIDYNNYLLRERPDIKYAVTLDADTKLTVDSIKDMVGTVAHPLNRPIIDENRGCIKEGYGIFQTAITTELESVGKSMFTKIFAGQGGMDTYSVKIADLYMDMCGEGIFTGKGIYDIEVFNKLLENAIPDNLVLSHDLLEGSYLRTGFINDMQMIDSYPSKYNSYAMRLHRWVRGDWQIFAWLMKYVKDRDGKRVVNPLNATSKWKIFDNLRRSWVDPALFLMLIGSFVLPGKSMLWIGLVLAAVFVLPVLGVAEMAINTFNHPQNKRYLTFSHVISGLQSLWLQKIIAISFLPFTACLMLGAVFKTLYRLAISKRKMLEWVTAADMETVLKGNLISYIILMKACVFFGIGAFAVTFFTVNPIIKILMCLFAFLWIIAPFTAWYISKPLKKREIKEKINVEDMEMLKEDARRMWNFYETFVQALDNHLPPDNIQFDPVFNVAHRTSPTNIGFYILSVVAAKDMGFIDVEEATRRIENTVNTLERLEKWNGHLYNWYDTMSLIPLRPHYISTVDSGNLQGYLLTVAVALSEMGAGELAQRCERLANDMDFAPLYDEERHLFSIGFNFDDGRLSNSYYDLLVSEARQTSFIAAAKRTVPEKHWKYLGRRPVTVKGHIGLASWTGTVFEFLMPNLIMKNFEASILNEALLTCVLAQIDYVKARTRPWGISESGFYKFDLNLNYQYKAFGVPRLGLKKGLGEEFVVAPYGSILALTLAPDKVTENLKIIRAIGAYGDYGYYEAIDYTSEKNSGEKYKIVKSYMAHHLGMSFISIHNFILEDLMKKRFHSIPYIKGAEYLLCEKVPLGGTPQNDAVMGDNRAKIRHDEEMVETNKVVSGYPTAGKMPSCGLVSNGQYSLFINNKGIGYSKFNDKILAEWEFDGKEYSGGFDCKVKNIDSGETFSIIGLGRRADKYDFYFGGESIGFSIKYGSLEINTDITVSAEDNVEIRRTNIINHSEQELVMEISGHISFALASIHEHMSHPVYNNLFITTEYVENGEIVIAAKRPKDEKKPYFYGFCTFPVNKGDIIGDLHTELSGERATLTRRVKIGAGEVLEFSFLFGMGENRAELIKLSDKYDDFSNADRAFSLSKLKTRNDTEEFALDILPHLFYHSAEKYIFQNEISQCNIERGELWTFGISLDNPLILSFIDASHGAEWILKLMETVRFFREKDLHIDLIFVAEEPSSYIQPVYNMITSINFDGCAKVIRGSELTSGLKKGLLAFASVIFNNEIFDVKYFDIEYEYITSQSNINNGIEYEARQILPNVEQRIFDNGTGFFDKNTNEYLIYNKPPHPWINVIASPSFGFTVDSDGQGCIWADNSRENRLTPWNNNIYRKPLSEELYFEDLERGLRIGLLSGEIPHVTRHGLGYTLLEFVINDIEIYIKIFCSFEKPVKITEVTVKNNSKERLNILFSYEVQPVIGVSPLRTMRHLHREFLKNGVIIRNVLPENVYGSQENIMYFSKESRIEAEAGEIHEICFVTGKAGSRREAEEMLSLAEQGSEDFGLSSERYYNEKFKDVSFDFKENSRNLMFNGRLLYQALSCRLYGRTAFYQSGGAYGYRDQLQDSLVFIKYDSGITKKQILHCCRRQFKEGDVQHWWHEPDGKGIRSRYSDDLLWLPYVVSEYLEKSKDWEILNSYEKFLESDVLAPDEKERYELPSISEEEGTVYEHCVRAIKYAMKYGVHGLPLMGGGDWNDGMNEVGGEKGESVWLAWFLLCVLNRFVKVSEHMGDTEQCSEFMQEVKRLLVVIDTEAYDGAWYRRAYFDSGEVLGSVTSPECSIDSISQSWGAITLNELDKNMILEPELKETYIAHLIRAMDSVEKYLTDYNLGLVKLLDPPFVKSKPNPGYIMGYIAGVRENGGQYTHAAVWYVKGLLSMAELVPSMKNEYIEKAVRILDILNPVNHTRTPLEVQTYRVEPYAVAADVYSDPDGKIAGRGGWTWYTGAAGWMQQIAEDLFNLLP